MKLVFFFLKILKVFMFNNKQQKMSKSYYYKKNQLNCSLSVITEQNYHFIYNVFLFFKTVLGWKTHVYLYYTVQVL